MANENFGTGVITEDRTSGMATGGMLSPSSVWKATPHTGLTLINRKAVAWLQIFGPNSIDDGRIVVGKLGLRRAAASLGDLTSLTQGNRGIESRIATRQTRTAFFLTGRKKRRVWSTQLRAFVRLDETHATVSKVTMIQKKAFLTGCQIAIEGIMNTRIERGVWRS